MKSQLFGKLASTLMLLGGLLWMQMTPAHAQFTKANISGLTETLLAGSGSGNEKYSLSLSNGATISFGGNTYTITGVSAFYEVGVTNAGATTSGLPKGWQLGNLAGHASGFSDNNGQGGFGSKMNYLKPGGTLQTFTFKAQPTSSTPFGFHIQYVSSSGVTSTGFFTPGPVPEPAFFQMAGLLTLGGLGRAVRKRKNRRSA